MVKRLMVAVILLLSFPVFAAKKTDEPVINLTLSNNSIWQREQLIISLEVISKDTLSRLDSQEYKQDGMTIIPFKQKIIERDNKLYLHLKWAVFPFVSGEHQLKLPRIRYRPNSGSPVTLRLPQLLVQVKSLPIYIPPTMPVGKIKLQTSWNNGSIISSKKLLEWNIHVTSNQVLPQTLPAISRLLKSSETLQILPFKRDLVVEKNEQGVTHKQSYKIPFKASSMGKLRLPKMNIQYFNPESGKLERARLKRPFVIVLNQWFLWLIGILFVALLILALLKIKPILQLFLKNKALKETALQSLNQATNYQRVKGALGQYAMAEGWGNNMTLDSFIEYYEVANPNKDSIRTLVDKLRGHEFSTVKHDDIRQLGNALYEKLR